MENKDSFARPSTGRLLWLLLSFMRPYLGWGALSVLLGVAAIASGVGLIATSAYLISAAALLPSIATLEVAIVGVRFFGLSRGAFRYLERLASHSVNFRLLARLRVWFYRRIEPLSPQVMLLLHSGDLLSRAVADVDRLENFYVRAVAPPAIALVILAGMALFFGSFDARLAGLFAGFFLLEGAALPAVVHLASRRPQQRWLDQQRHLTVTLVDGIQGMADVLAFGGEKDWLRRLHVLGKEANKAQDQLAWIGGLQAGLASLLTDLGAWAVLAVGIGLAMAGKLDPLYLAVLFLAATSAFEASTALPAAAQTLESSLLAAGRLSEVGGETRREERTLSLPVLKDTSLEVRHLGFTYPGSRFSLKEISFTIEPGNRVALVGPSGAGKTTLANLLLRLVDWDEGEVRFGGVDLHPYRPEDLQACIGVVSQAGYLFDDTLGHNITVGDPEAGQARLDEVVHLAQLDGLVAGLPQGLDTWVGEHGLRLSGGERQRVAIARALLQDAPLLVLDEVTNNLDVLTAARLMDLILDLWKGRSLLTITHSTLGLERFDEVLVMQNGRIVERGRHGDLWEAKGVYRKMFEVI